MPADPLFPEWREALRQAAWVGLGGFLGANARYWLGRWIDGRWGGAFPWGTFAINVTGSFLLGLLMGAILHRLPPSGAPALRLAVAVGFLGAYTTFSTFEFETLALLGSGGGSRAAAYVLGSVLAGLAAAWAGFSLGRLA